jgi:hypothetical protein
MSVAPIRVAKGAAMADMVYQYLDQLTRYAGNFDRQHWVLLSVVVLVMGLICMRGFGSRTNY